MYALSGRFCHRGSAMYALVLDSPNPSEEMRLSSRSSRCVDLNPKREKYFIAVPSTNARQPASFIDSMLRPHLMSAEAHRAMACALPEVGVVDTGSSTRFLRILLTEGRRAERFDV